MKGNGNFRIVTRIISILTTTGAEACVDMRRIHQGRPAIGTGSIRGIGLNQFCQRFDHGRSSLGLCRCHITVMYVLLLELLLEPRVNGRKGRSIIVLLALLLMDYWIIDLVWLLAMSQIIIFCVVVAKVGIDRKKCSFASV
jgi:hypothetical protein